ncbi:MAG: hypothetical protein K2Z81_28555, partial [Cyanobacteria bacterium]|nr:hypothetical protein [Cyanobacteriota bacterium]
MKGKIAAALIALCLATGSVAPVNACEECSTKEDPATFAARLPVRTAALASGVAVGAPLTAARSAAGSSFLVWYVLSSDAGNNALTNILCIPPSIAIGTVVGTLH